MRAKLTVVAEGTWALQPLVEKMMEHRASAAFREWVRFADTFLTDNYGTAWQILTRGPGRKPGALLIHVEASLSWQIFPSTSSTRL